MKSQRNVYRIFPGVFAFEPFATTRVKFKQKFMNITIMCGILSLFVSSMLGIMLVLGLIEASYAHGIVLLGPPAMCLMLMVYYSRCQFLYEPREIEDKRWAFNTLLVELGVQDEPNILTTTCVSPPLEERLYLVVCDAVYDRLVDLAARKLKYESIGEPGEQLKEEFAVMYDAARQAGLTTSAPGNWRYDAFFAAAQRRIDEENAEKRFSESVE